MCSCLGLCICFGEKGELGASYSAFLWMLLPLFSKIYIYICTTFTKSYCFLVAKKVSSNYEITPRKETFFDYTTT